MTAERGVNKSYGLRMGNSLKVPGMLEKHQKRASRCGFGGDHNLQTDPGLMVVAASDVPMRLRSYGHGTDHVMCFGTQHAAAGG